MRIAIVENGNLHQYIKDHGSGQWEVEHFRNSSELGKADIDQYDVILSDYELPNYNGRDLIKSISPKTNAQLFLMSSNNSFNEDDINNERIKGLINKDDPETVLDQIKYADVKIRLNKIMEEESNRYEDLYPTNGFKVKTLQDGVVLIQITNVLSSKKRDMLTDKLKENNIRNAVFSFPELEIMSSMYLNVLVYFYRLFKKRNGNIVLWNSTGSKNIFRQMKLCNLISLFPVYDTLEECLNYLIPNDKSSRRQDSAKQVSS